MCDWMITDAELCAMEKAFSKNGFLSDKNLPF